MHYISIEILVLYIFQYEHRSVNLHSTVRALLLFKTFFKVFLHNEKLNRNCGLFMTSSLQDFVLSHNVYELLPEKDQEIPLSSFSRVEVNGGSLWL